MQSRGLQLTEIRATYRLQLEPAFGFEQAAALVPYLAELGITHAYASPVFEAVAGSRHGYDISNPAAVREALGGTEGWRRFTDALHRHGLGMVLDIVPNHLALEGNAWWNDLLEHGSDSAYFHYFDLDLAGEIGGAPSGHVLLIPVLAEPYGEELDAGRLQLVVEDGRLRLAYATHRFPLAASAIASIQEGESARSEEDLRTLAAAINRDPARLHDLLERQHYRLTWWRLARDESPYRRFFDVNGLVGVRVDQEDVFAAVHRLVLEWCRNGTVQGLRVDHVDGLADPAAYLERLRSHAPDQWIVVEKILAAGESLPPWPVDGTTGYEFGALVTRLLMAPEAEESMTTAYQELAGMADSFEEAEDEARHEVLGHWLSGDAKRVALALHRLCLRDIRLRDFSIRDATTLVEELAASARVYRTYVSPRGASAADAAVIEALFASVQQRRPDVPAPLLAFASHLFATGGEDGEGREFVARFQQLCTAVAAKAVEDTAFYRYHRCLALNDVGANPGQFSTDAAAFHHTILAWQQQHPLGMRSTATHDSKRGEDVRARLTVLTEVADIWIPLVRRWAERSDAHRIDGQPDRNFEYYLYQTLAGAWPLSRDRAHTHAEKAARESKVFTNWLTPSEEYERAVHHFVDGLYDDGAFIEELSAFVASLHPADWTKALSQLLLKLTVPGVPDIYQGSELWQLALTDPDNRAAVDFDSRRLLLDECASLPAAAVLARMDEGLPKLWTLARALALRARHADLAAAAAYAPLEVRGPRAEHAVAFLRGSAIAVVVPIRTFDPDWHDTRVVLPAGSWTHVLGEATLDGGECRLQTLFHHFPVALLERSAA